MHGNCEPELRWADGRDLLPGAGAVGRAEGAVVVLRPQRVGCHRTIPVARRVPQRLVARPGIAVVPRQEQAARNRPAPDQTGLIGAAALEAELVRHARSILVAFDLGEGRRRDLLPALAVVGRALQLDAEMAERRRGVERTVPRVGEQRRDRVAEESHLCDLPSLPPPPNVEEALARVPISRRSLMIRLLPLSRPSALGIRTLHRGRRRHRPGERGRRCGRRSRRCARVGAGGPGRRECRSAAVGSPRTHDRARRGRCRPALLELDTQDAVVDSR